MTTHATGPLAGLSWLKRGVNLGRQNARAVFGGAAILMFMALVPSLVQGMVQAMFNPGVNGSIAIAAVVTVLSILILSPLVGGYLRLIDATEHGRPAHATDVFSPFGQGGDAGRLIGFGVLMTLTYLVIAMIVISLFGDGFLDWYMKVLTLSQESAGGKVDPSKIPALPEGFARMVGLGSLFGLFLSGVYALGFGQVALGRRPIGGAIVDGVLGTLKNLIPMLVLAIVVFLLSIGLGIVLALVFRMIIVVGDLVHPTLSLILLLPIYLALMIALYVVMFGVMYYFWRDVCGGQEPPPLRDDQVAL